MDDLGLTLGNTVPEPFVPILVATRNAWFPHEKDVDNIIKGLPTKGEMTEDERVALVNYLTTTWIGSRDEERVIEVVNRSPIADEVDLSQLRVKSLPSLPQGIDFGVDQGTTCENVSSGKTEMASAAENVSSETTPQVGENQDTAVEELQEVPGIGEKRANDILSLGITTLQDLAEMRPADLAEAPGLSYELALVAVEGAREVTGGKRSTADRLAEETGCDVSTFEAALSSLAASGVPPSEAAAVLRTLYGPTVADIDYVTGQQAYFLWREGYQTPTDVIQASVDELLEVPQLGAKTAPQIKAAAEELVAELRIN